MKEPSQALITAAMVSCLFGIGTIFMSPLAAFVFFSASIGLGAAAVAVG